MRFKHLAGALKIVLGMFVGITLYANFGPQSEPLYRDVIVEKKVIETVERVDTVVRWREKIVFKTVQAEQRATAEGGAVSDVERFCGPDEQPSPDVVGVEDQTPQPPQLLLRSLRLEDGWFFQKDRLILTGPLSNGDLRQETFRTRGSVQAHVHGDSVIVQFPRAALLKQGAEVGTWVALGVIIGKVFW